MDTKTKTLLKPYFIVILRLTNHFLSEKRIPFTQNTFSLSSIFRKLADNNQPEPKHTTLTSEHKNFVKPPKHWLK